MPEPTRKEDAKNLSIITGAGLVAALVTLAFLAQAAPAPLTYEVIVPIEQPAPIVAVEVEPVPVVEPTPVVEAVQVLGNNRIYGRMVTRRGAEYEGYIRWDRNEGSWADLLDANKSNAQDVQVIRVRRERDRDRRHRRDRGRDHDMDHDMDVDHDNMDMDIDIDLEDKLDLARELARENGIRLGEGSVVIGNNLRIRLTSIITSSVSSSVKSGIRFGHIDRIEVLDGRSALVTLKSGEEVEFSANATDLGTAMRAFIIEDAHGATREFDWLDLDLIDFMPAPDNHSPNSARLYGTMTTRSGYEFTGYVVWDVDEIYGADVLDGEENGVDREIPFSEIALIERDSSRGAYVVLKNGDEMILRGSNDVNQSNRGIAVSDPALGQVKVSWREFESVRFHEADQHSVYGQYDGGTPLRGTVVTDSGEELSGQIRWDNDEAFTWEMLNGNLNGIDFNVEFSQIARITRDGSRGVTVQLKDGRTFDLDGSNDVDSGNRGIFVETDEGRTYKVDWGEFVELRLDS